MNRYTHTMCMAFGADGEPDRVEVDVTFDYLVAGSAVSDIRVLKIDGSDVNVADADLHDRIHDDLESGRFDDLLISLVTPSPQSVVVPVGGGYDASDVRYGLHLIANEDCDEVAASYYAKKALAHLAALSPEAPAREGEELDDDDASTYEPSIAGLSDYLWNQALGAESVESRCILEMWREAVDALTPRHEAPAEGAGSFAGSLAVALEDLSNAAEVVRRMLHNSKDHQSRAFDEAGIPFVTAINRARLVLKDYDRARSSAPEAREEALGNLLAVIHSDGGHRALEVGTEQAALEAEKIVAGLFAAPSADKLRIAVETLEGIASMGLAGPEKTARQALAALKAEGGK